MRQPLIMEVQCWRLGVASVKGWQQLQSAVEGEALLLVCCGLKEVFWLG